MGQNKSVHGYIIIVTLMGISLAIILLTAIVQQTFSYQRKSRIAIDAARARMLALSSLEIAASQVSQVIFEKDEKSEKKPAEGDKKEKEVLEPLQKWLLKVLPSLNRWQTIELNEGELGLEGTVKLYIVCEQGKINLMAFENELDGAQEKPKNEEKSAGEQKPGEIKKERHGALSAIDDYFKKEKDVSIKETLKSFKQKYNRMPEDPTELLKIKAFEKVKEILFMPSKEEKKAFYIMDLFTVRSGNQKLNPWLLTRSAKTLFGLKEKGDAKIDKEFVKEIKTSMNWQQDWDKVLGQRYGKNFAAFEPDIQDLFASEFEAKAFSVVSYSTVGTVTQKLYAVLDLAEPGPGISPKSLIFKVSKLYWL
jgi:hypothetical protein